MSETAQEVNSKFIDGKLKYLEFIGEEFSHVISKRDVKLMTRQAETLEKVINQVHESKQKLQEAKIEADESPTTVRDWTKQLDSKLKVYEKQAKELRKEVNNIESIWLEKLKKKRNESVITSMC